MFNLFVSSVFFTLSRYLPTNCTLARYYNVLVKAVLVANTAVLSEKAVSPILVEIEILLHGG